MVRRWVLVLCCAMVAWFSCSAGFSCSRRWVLVLCCALVVRASGCDACKGNGGGVCAHAGPAGAAEARHDKLASWRRRAAQAPEVQGECAERFANSLPDGEGGCRCKAGYMMSAGQCVPNDALRGGGEAWTGGCRAGDGTAAEQAYAYAGNPERFQQDTDHEAATRLARAFAAASLCSRDHVVLIGGVNEGQLASNLLQECAVTAHGVEIQHELVRIARERLLQCCPSATVHHLGWSNRPQERVRVAAIGGYGGLYSAEQLAAAVRPDGRPHILSRHASDALQQEAEWEREGRGSFTNTVALGEWVEEELGLDSILYLAIDAEGHEARIIEGMGLEDERNRRRFAAFQFEVGGTWAERDPRRAVPSWSLEDTANFLHYCEYDLYLIGDNVHMRVHPQFFVEGAIHDEGFGLFVRGNVLALHREFVHPAIRDHVLRTLLRPRPDLCQ